MSEALRGLAIQNREPDQKGSKSGVTPSGRFTNQAELLVCLHMHYNIRLPLFAVEYPGYMLRKDQ